MESDTAQGHAGSKTAKVDETKQAVMLYSVCYFTNRREPHFEWFMDSLAAQSHDLEETQLILVDYWLAPGHPHTKPEGRASPDQPGLVRRGQRAQHGVNCRGRTNLRWRG